MHEVILESERMKSSSRLCSRAPCQLALGLKQSTSPLQLRALLWNFGFVARTSTQLPLEGRELCRMNLLAWKLASLDPFGVGDIGGWCFVFLWVLFVCFSSPNPIVMMEIFQKKNTMIFICCNGQALQTFIVIYACGRSRLGWALNIMSLPAPARDVLGEAVPAGPQEGRSLTECCKINVWIAVFTCNPLEKQRLGSQTGGWDRVLSNLEACGTRISICS